jgi:hypothetical protein
MAASSSVVAYLSLASDGSFASNAALFYAVFLAAFLRSLATSNAFLSSSTFSRSAVLSA